MNTKCSGQPDTPKSEKSERTLSLGERLASETQGYIDLAGETFREEEALLEARLFGQKSGQK